MGRGTIGYLPPEGALEATNGQSYDVYGLLAMGHDMLTGVPACGILLEQYNALPKETKKHLKAACIEAGVPSDASMRLSLALCKGIIPGIEEVQIPSLDLIAAWYHVACCLSLLPVHCTGMLTCMILTEHQKHVSFLSSMLCCEGKSDQASERCASIKACLSRGCMGPVGVVE